VILFNQILNGRFSGAVTRMFQIKGPGSPVPTLAPEIGPSYDVNDRSDPAQPFLQNTKLAGCAGFISAVAAQYSHVKLVNPSGSGVLIEVDGILLHTSASAAVRIGFGTNTAALAAPITAWPRDGRWFQNGSMAGSTARFSQETNAILPTPQYPFDWMVPDSRDLRPTQIVLPPGLSLNCWATIVNLSLSWSIQYRERALPPEEAQSG